MPTWATCTENALCVNEGIKDCEIHDVAVVVVSNTKLGESYEKTLVLEYFHSQILNI